MDPSATEEPDDNLGTFLVFLLLLLCNMTGSGIFYLGLTTPGSGTEVSNYALAFIACCASLNSFISLMQLMDVYDKCSYLDLVELMTSRTCAKVMALLFLVARVGSLVAIISTMEWKILELTSLMKVEHEPNGGLVLAIAAACVVFVELCAYVVIGSPIQQTVYNMTTIDRSIIGSVHYSNTGYMQYQSTEVSNLQDQSTQRSGPQDQSKNRGVVELGIRKILIFLLLSTYFAFTAVYVFHWIRIMINEPKHSTLDEQEEANWFAAPVIVYATSSFAVVNEFPKEIRRCVSTSRTNFVRMILFLVLFQLPTAYTVLSFFYRPGTFEDPYLAKIQCFVCILTILICSLAASLRLEACSNVCAKILGEKVTEGSTHIIFTYGVILAVSLLASFIIGDAESVIAYSGSTMYPFLLWFVPNGLCALRSWRERNGMSIVLFHAAVLVFTTGFIATHVIALHSAEIPPTYYRYPGRY